MAAVCRGLMLEVSALRARVAHLEQEKSSLAEKLGLTFKERYDPLVRHLFSTCIQLKVGNKILVQFLRLLPLLYSSSRQRSNIRPPCMFAPQARLDEYRRQMEQDVSERVNRVRGEGVDRIIKLKKTYGCTRDDDGLTLTQVKVR